MKFIRLLFLIIPFMLTLLLMPVAVVASSQTVSESEDLVLNAFEQLQNYAFTGQFNTITDVTDQSGETTRSVIAILMEGIINADGSRQTNLKQFTGPDLLSALTTRALIVDQIVIGDEHYIKVGNLEYLETVEPGWWRYDDLVSQFESVSIQVMLDGLVKIQVPSEYSIKPEFIQSVTELDSEIINNRIMRVFEVELDGIALSLAQMPGTPEEKQDYIDQNSELMDAIELNITHRVWIGADDGLLYQGTFANHTFLPYLTVFRGQNGTSNSMPSFDVTTDSTGSFKITSHEAHQELAAPVVNQVP